MVAPVVLVECFQEYWSFSLRLDFSSFSNKIFPHPLTHLKPFLPFFTIASLLLCFGAPVPKKAPSPGSCVRAHCPSPSFHSTLAFAPLTLPSDHPPPFFLSASGAFNFPLSTGHSVNPLGPLTPLSHCALFYVLTFRSNTFIL